MKKVNNSQVEIMAPAGSYESLMAAINAGADSVYFGIEQLNMRARSANNFTTEDLKKIVKTCKEHNVKTYLTINTILYDHDIILMKKIVDTAKESGVTAIIAADISTIQYAREKNVEVHISTQCNVSNLESVKFYSKYADVIVLARELTIQQIKSIVDEIKKQDIRGPKGNLIEIEIFAHGALCVAVSGICYMGLAQYNSSANRGACLQPCRRSYKITDEETGEAVEAVFNGTYDEEKIVAWTKELEGVFNRGFWQGGYYLGKKLGDWSGTYGSKATKEKSFIGLAEHYFPKTKIAQFELEKEQITVGDEIIITGTTTGVINAKVETIYVNEKQTESAKKGDTITIPLSERVRKGDKLYVVKPKTELQGNNKLKVLE